MPVILIKLFLAHLIGDFLLQPRNWVKEKEDKKLKSSKLYLHILIHTLLMLLLTIGSNWYLQIFLIAFTHFCIDFIKLILQTENTKRRWFLMDQTAHILVILLIWYITESPEINFSFWNDQRLWILILGLVAVTWPAGVAIRMAVAKWTPKSNNSLISAGKYIGIIERLLIFLFVYTNRWEAIGFLLAAKSIFRFGELKGGNDLKLTEYVLIGTLLSFGLAIAAALFTLKLQILK